VSRGGQPPTLPGLEAFGLSPLRRQYLELKRTSPGCLLLFRLGDFYEMFDGDAETAANILGIVLTSREMGRGERVPMAGIPCHSADGYIARLVGAGCRVAICEQVSEPNGRDLVDRRVLRIITPGTVQDALLTSASNNFLAALYVFESGAGLAYVDVTTGELHATELRGPGWDAGLQAELSRVTPSECLVADGQTYPSGAGAPLVTTRQALHFGAARAEQTLTRQFRASTLHGLGLAEFALATRALGALLEYVAETHAAALGGLMPPRVYESSGHMLLDVAARAALELAPPSGGGRSVSSLLQVLDRTQSPMGGRLLAAWIAQPLADVEALRCRLDGVEELVQQAWLRARVRTALDGIGDLERLAARSAQRLSTPRDLRGLARALRKVSPVADVLLEAGNPRPILNLLPSAVDACGDLAAAIESTIVDDPPTTMGEGVIRAGISAELDEARSLSGDARHWLAALEKEERERTGARGLKVGYNRVFGYFLEVSTATLGQPTDYYQKQQTGALTVADHLGALGYVRKQTLSSAERFVTQELKEHERRVEQSRERCVALEESLYATLLERLAAEAHRMAATARALAVLDVMASLADAAAVYGYVRPQVDESTTLMIRGGRHPVVERTLPSGEYVPNDVELGGSTAPVMVLTGPNMAGKSTFGKSVLLLVLMAQVGSFVPADSAHVGIVDRIFVRAGSAEDLAGGRSTFMVEMEETATFLRHATARSMAFLDEVGRGTSTFDGMALARSILEFTVGPLGPRSRLIFSTHYHELAALEEETPMVMSYRMDVQEDGDRAVFLYRAVPGGADRSFGVHVARLAGIPEVVTRRAAELLLELEAKPHAAPPARQARVEEVDAVCVELAQLDVERMTPLEALTALHRLTQAVRSR
jgi:DNA mismatch repair protein MutS